MRRLLSLILLLVALPASAGLLDALPNAKLGAPLNNSSDFLPVREAFRLSLVNSDARAIQLQFVAADGYYLYRHRFQFRTEPADIALGEAVLPAGEAKTDDYFGDVEVYHGVLDVQLPLNNTQQRPFTLQVTYQGCADKGLCYPPETQSFAIGDAPAAKSANPANAWSWRELALFFLAGLGLTFTPCVLPMLPILSGVVLRGQVGGHRQHVGAGQAETAQAVSVAAGAATVEVLATCTQAGVVGNGFVPGQIKTLVGTPSGLVVTSVENITTSEGGADEESDERLRERIVAAPETFSVAGSVEAYRFHAMSAHPDIVDVAVISHIPGDVTLYPLTSSGLPGETIKAAVLATCSGEKVRPLNDQVMVADPVPVNYAIDVRVVLTRTADAALAQAQVEQAALDFRDNRVQFGTSIVRSQLIDALHVYGVYSITPVQPVADLYLEKWEWPRCTSIKVTVTGVAR